MPMNLFLKKVINSGQDGAEQGALGAAFLMNCPTGGNTPKSYNTAHGPKPQLKVFNLIETDNDKFPTAVSKNVQESDGTLLFISHPADITKPEEFIIEQCDQYQKPFMKVPRSRFVKPEELLSFVKKHKIHVLHVSGKIDQASNKMMFTHTKELMERFLKLVIRDARRDETSETFATSGVAVG